MGKSKREGGKGGAGRKHRRRRINKGVRNMHVKV